MNVEIMKKIIPTFDAIIMICYVIISTSYLSYNYDLVCQISDFYDIILDFLCPSMS